VTTEQLLSHRSSSDKFGRADDFACLTDMPSKAGNKFVRIVRIDSEVSGNFGGLAWANPLTIGEKHHSSKEVVPAWNPMIAPNTRRKSGSSAHRFRIKRQDYRCRKLACWPHCRLIPD
jgi:hypothetical protein